MANESWRTAITRRDKRTRDRALTAPTRTLIESEYMGTMHWGPPSTNQHSGGLILSVLDFGAGKSFDADLIGEMHPGIETTAYDPNAPRLSETIATDVVPSREHYDLVLVNFVLNVQQTRAEAMEVLKAAMSHVRYAGYIWVATQNNGRCAFATTKCHARAATTSGSALTNGQCCGRSFSRRPHNPVCLFRFAAIVVTYGRCERKLCR